MKQWYLLAFLLGSILYSTQLQATHIVGGEITYTHLSGDQYEIALTIFRDCYNGNPGAFFDDPASIGVFDTSGMLIYDIRLDLMNNDTLEPILNDECFVAPPDVCVHTTTYRDTIELPLIPGGYVLAYQRCCRNQTIQNVVEPLGTGATYSVEISERALQENNSSAKIEAWPPLYICVNEPIFFDQSALDSDGDSIVYRLCAPLNGASQANPIPQPPAPPPYAEVDWGVGFGVENMLNGTPGSPPLAIDINTGELTGTPNTIGQFVVGICVEEYRDGELISTTRRDFQYNVGICSQALSAFFTPEIQCDNLTVVTDNNSLSSDTFNWYFGPFDDPLFFSEAEAPVYTFPDTGSYEITLIASPSTTCADTFSREIILRESGLMPAFTWEVTECDDSLTLTVMANSISPIYPIVSHDWTLEPFGLTATGEMPSFTVGNGGAATLTLVTTVSNDCSAEVSESIFIDLVDWSPVSDTMTICPGTSVSLNPLQTPFLFSWTPEESLSDPDIQNPVASPDTTTLYIAMIESLNGICTKVDSILVEVLPEADVVLPPDFATCEETVSLSVLNPDTSLNYRWSLSPNFLPVLAEGPTFEVTPFGTQTYYVGGEGEDVCLSVDSITVAGQAINGFVSSGDTLCEEGFRFVSFFNLDLTDTLSFQWTPTDLIIGAANQASALVRPTEPGITEFIVQVENQFGCTLSDTVSMQIIDTEDQSATFSSQQCAETRVEFSSTSTNANLFLWDFGDPNQPGASATGAQVSHTYTEPGTYEVMVTTQTTLPCPDTTILEVVVEDPFYSLSFDNSLENCSDTAVYQLTNTSTITGASFVDISWIIDGMLVEEDMPQVVFDEAGVALVSLVTTTNTGCVDTLTAPIVVHLIDIDFPDSIVICAGSPVTLFGVSDEAYDFLWAPPELLNDPTLPMPVAIVDMDTVFTVTVSDNTGCELMDSISVVVTPAPDYAIFVEDTICTSSTTISVDVPMDVTFGWFEVGTPDIPLGNNEQLTVTPGSGTFYRLELEDESGCIFSDSILLRSQAIQADLPPAFVQCSSDSVQLLLTHAEDTSMTYSWSPDGPLLSAPDVQQPWVTVENTTTFMVSLTNGAGCTLELSTEVMVIPDLNNLVVTADRDSVYGPTTVNLMSSIDNPDFQYSWTPPENLNDPTIPDPTAFVDGDITYFLTVTDENGCTQMDSVMLFLVTQLCEFPHIYLPNAFTPNGDGENDLLLLRGEGVDVMRLEVYNRWGERVFLSTDKTKGWDGTYKGKALPPDVYGFTLEVECFNGGRWREKGNVTLLR